jgi:predicted GH43/DUF377 family glycosyl hydrolase
VTNSFIVTDDKICDNLSIIEDPRIFKIDDQYKLLCAMPLFFNNFLSGPLLHINKIIMGLYDCDNDFSLTPAEIPVCGFLSKKYEKNWTPFEYNKKIYFLYNMTMECIINLDTVSIDAHNIHYNILHTIEQKTRMIYFSGGSPAIDYLDNLKIAVGHVKINTLYAMHKGIINTINNFLKDYIYFMFFYTFCPTTGKVFGVSDMFIPIEDIEKIDYLLVFPTSLIDFNQHQYIISYGEGDIRCKLCIFDKKDLILYKLSDITGEHELNFRYYIKQ